MEIYDSYPPQGSSGARRVRKVSEHGLSLIRRGGVPPGAAVIIDPTETNHVRVLSFIIPRKRGYHITYLKTIISLDQVRLIGHGFSLKIRKMNEITRTRPLRDTACNEGLFRVRSADFYPDALKPPGLKIP